MLRKMFMKLLSFSLILAFMMFIVLSCNEHMLTVSAKDVDSETVPPEEMFVIQENAVQANEKIYASFEWDQTYIYPDDFAGTYIDYDTLHILLTGNENLAYYYDIIKDYSENVVFDMVPASYNNIFESVASFASSLSETFALVSYGVDVKNNCGIIRFGSEQEEKMFDLYENTVEYNGVLIKLIPSSAIEKTSSIYGGTAISASTSALTLSGSGTYQGGCGFLTCGHGTHFIGESLKVNGTPFATIYYRNYSDSAYGDYSIAYGATGYTSINRVYTNSGYTYITGVLSNPAVGTYLYKYGAVTGESYCCVTYTGQTIFDGTNTIYGMTFASLLSGSDVKGNSGGPYRQANNFCGVHHGFITSDSNIVIFTPYVYPNNAGFSW